MNRIITLLYCPECGNSQVLQPGYPIPKRCEHCYGPLERVKARETGNGGLETLADIKLNSMEAVYAFFRVDPDGDDLTITKDD